MAIVIKGNKGRNIGGDLIKIDVPHNVSLEVSDNQGKNVRGHIVNLTVRVGSDSLGAFVAEASKHFHELDGDQQSQFNRAIELLKKNDSSHNKPALKWLYDLSVAVPGKVIASIIVKFLGIGS